MKITFADGQVGFHEARALHNIARYAAETDPFDSHEIQLLDALQSASEAHMSRPEFEALYAVERDWSVVAHPHYSLGRLWCGLFGPSRRERLLSEQRIAALERAEHSSFESLAETARVARERDDSDGPDQSAESGAERTRLRCGVELRDESPRAPTLVPACGCVAALLSGAQRTVACQILYLD